MIRFSPIVAVLAAAALMLGGASAAQAGFHVSMSSSQGLAVTTDNPNSGDPTLVTGQLTPEGSVANWDVGALCVTNVLDPLGNLCIDTNDSDCHAQDRGFGKEIRCARIHAGVSISTQGGDDNIHVGTSASDPVSIDAGSGNDIVSSASIFSDIAVDAMLAGGCARLRESDSEGNQRARPSSERPLPA